MKEIPILHATYPDAGNPVRFLILLLLLSMSSCQHADDAEKALKDARRLAREGDYEGALAKHVWFHNNALKVRPSYYGVRLSFALSDWIELGQKYPKALQQLKAIRDDNTSQLLNGKFDRELFHDVAAINEHLAESTATVALFKSVAAVNPAVASDIYDLADKALLEAREFVLARKYMGDPDSLLATDKWNFDEGMKFAKTAERGDVSRRAHEHIFTTQAIQIITVLMETGDKTGARRIQTEALKTLDTPEIRNAVKD